MASSDIPPPVSAPVGIEVGEPAPIFALRNHNGGLTDLRDDRLAGRPVVLVFCRTVTEDFLPALRTLAARSTATATRSFSLRIVTRPPANAALASGDNAPLMDAEGGVFRSYGITGDLDPGRTRVVVIDRTRRISLICVTGDFAAQAEAALAHIDALIYPGGKLTLHPPVLVIPRALSAAECETLIAVWHRPVPRFHTTGFKSVPHEQGDFKLRNDTYGVTDQFVVRDRAIQQFLDARLFRRALPELEKAFQTRIAYREDYRIACYDAAEGGSLPGHRDNPIPATRHRLFTISVHLNAGEYSGGGLCFREYGDQVYEVERGAAIIWSCSLLHEVTPMVHGRRFILGTHLFNDLDAMQAGLKDPRLI